MRMWISYLLAAAMAQAPRPSVEPVEVVSADGSCKARIERDVVTVSRAHSDGTARKLWDAPFRSNIAPAKFALADSGRVIAQIGERYNDSHALVRVQARDRDPVTWSGSDLGIPREVLGGTQLERSWLDETRAPSLGWTDSWYGPCFALDIFCRGGLIRRIDLEHMNLVEITEVPEPVQVDPPVQVTLPERCAVPYVQSVSAPSVARAGVPLEITIHASHATPGWTLLGFELEASGDDGRTLQLTPRSRAPDGISAQVISSFRTVARLSRLRPGRYTLDVAGWNVQHQPLTIDVVPESLLMRLNTSGGIAGIDQWIEILTPSVARIERRRDAPATYLELGEERMQKLRELLGALPAENRRAETKDAADLFAHSLGFWSGEEWITIEVDDLAATPAERELIQALRML